jgi:DNA-directed RNA polymerase beta' subunit
MGHIELAAPVTHIWYFKGVPSRLGYLLDLAPKDLEKVIYFQDYVVLDPKDTPLKKQQLLTEEEFREARATYGDGSFDAVGYPGGLPGDGWTPPTKLRGTGTRDGAVVSLEGLDIAGAKRRGRIEGGSLTVLDDAGKAIATFPKVERTSPTLGQTPPEGAIVIFDGSGPVDEATTLIDPRLSEDGLLMEGVTAKGSFGDAHWHIEFRLPYQPKDRGQARGNSGAYIAGAYEVQMLDSFGLEGMNNECGGVYSVAAPLVNMCLPPLAWQTYDIDFTAPRFEGDTKVKDAVMTVRHNGVVIQDSVSVPKITPGGPQNKEGPSGQLHLQNHGNPVRYRNIWVLPKS